MIGVAVQDVARAKAMRERTGASFPLLADPDHAATDAYGVFDLLGDGLATPSVFIVDAAGTIVWSPIGGYTQENIIPQAQCVQSTDGNGIVSFTLSQVSLICRQNAQAMDTRGTAKAVYPEKYITHETRRTKEAVNLAELMTFSRTSFKGGNAPIVIAFNVPGGMTAKFLRFKQNVIVELPRSTAYSGEMEQLLDGEE